jgi:hypothetical protein
MTTNFINMAQKAAFAHCHISKRLPQNATEIQGFNVPIWVINAMKGVSGVGVIGDTYAIDVAAKAASEGPKQSPYTPQSIRDAVNLQPAAWIVESIKRAALEPSTIT